MKLILILAWMATGAAHAASDLAGSVKGNERARINQERAAIESRFQTRDKACRQRFVVSSCVEDARRERRTGLDGLKERQRAVDEQRRQERTRAKQAELAAKAAEDARREGERTSRAASNEAKTEARVEAKTSAAARAVERAASAQARPPRRTPAPSATTAQRQSLEAENRAAFEARQRKAAEHRKEAEDKATRRLQKHAPAKALPTP